ncbi:hypothetical protein QE152_g5404 [Popillia japonica]|uniref:Uncharacterized protein n=1 Tax=Popillia japonica TaxID=7064 RepID=A0AAW1MSU1_POPJA
MLVRIKTIANFKRGVGVVRRVKPKWNLEKLKKDGTMLLYQKTIQEICTTKAEQCSNRNIKNFYQEMKKAAGTKQTRTLYCKNKEGKQVGDEKEILETWRSHFEDILNPKDKIHVAEVEEKYAENDEIEVLPPTKEEEAIKKWKKCREEWGSG